MPSVVNVSRTRKQIGFSDHAPTLEVIVVDWTADTDGSVAFTSVGEVCGILQRIVTDPGTPAPTDLYDIALEDEDAVDMLGGAGQNRSNTQTQEAEIKMSSFQRVVANFGTFKLTGNSVSGAKGIAKIYVLR